MVEFILFVAACAAIAFLVKNIQNNLMQPKTKLQPIKIDRKEKRRHPARKHQD
ncbi:hypothetical protein OFY17_04560 [Marinomonas sp. C2222]|uniref:Uncharacterized protein n=1 Tax=Marinomonas sargassi TaxID=2984494 RepID=A0ABT2YQJ7_9GAMM|nr:hypothetical protein [Marinomonas sargassi]MCV2402156.1 hypothetical protein [Marinomonas sargassi]